MRWILILLMLFLLMAFACDKDQNPEYFQEKFADISNISDSGYMKCKIGSLNYFTNDLLIYHINEANSKIIYSPIGEYMKPANYNMWQLRLYKDKKNSVYNKTWEYIINRQLPNGEEFTCESITKLPTVFSGFLKSHSKLFRDYKKPEVIEFD